MKQKSFKIGVRPFNEKRGGWNLYIEADTILKIMKHAPDAEWRLIIALWRFAGLRAFSEVLSLKWTDILWDQKEMVVHSPKTAHHAGKGFRIIPFFPYVEECLRDAQREAPDGAIYVVEKHAPRYLRGQKERGYISRQGNMGTMFRKIMRRAGVAEWKKLIQNLRASFEIDLLSKEYGEFNIYVIAKWLGHSVKVMLEHYGRFQKSDYAKIAEACERVRREKEEAKGEQEPHSIPFLPQNEGLIPEATAPNPLKKTSPKAAQHTAATMGIVENDGETNQPQIVLHLPQVLENKVYEGGRGQEVESRVNCLDCQHGGNCTDNGCRWIRTIDLSLIRNRHPFTDNSP